jgi:diguanylate cyclase (GGDEF)-like protein
MERARSTVAADRQALQALTAVARDALARLAITREKVHVARHDPLTDLPNRGILLDRTDHALTRARRHGSSVALLFLDLDGFKPVNDRFGHAAGDAVLVEVAERIRGCIRDTDTAARLGGDEFAVLFEDVDLGAVVAMSERVLAAVREGVVVAGEPMPLSASAGLAYADSRDSGAGLLGKADLAMYEAKTRGKDCLVTYQHTIGKSRMERLVMVEDLRRAIAESRIDVVYQPVVATTTRRTVGVEALARWERNGRAVSPDVFIRLAEDAGLVVALGDVVLAQVEADAALLRRSVPGELIMSVNISAQQLRTARSSTGSRGPSARWPVPSWSWRSPSARASSPTRTSLPPCTRSVRWVSASPSTTSASASPRSATSSSSRSRSSRPTGRSRTPSTPTRGPARCSGRSP